MPINSIASIKPKNVPESPDSNPGHRLETHNLLGGVSMDGSSLCSCTLTYTHCKAANQHHDRETLNHESFHIPTILV